MKYFAWLKYLRLLVIVLSASLGFVLASAWIKAEAVVPSPAAQAVHGLAAPTRGTAEKSYYYYRWHRWHHRHHWWRRHYWWRRHHYWYHRPYWRRHYFWRHHYYRRHWRRHYYYY